MSLHHINNCRYSSLIRFYFEFKKITVVRLKQSQVSKIFFNLVVETTLSNGFTSNVKIRNDVFS